MAAKAEGKVAAWKQEVLSELIEMFDRYPIVGVLSIGGLPAAQFQRIRQQLHGQAEIVVSKNTLLKLAIEKVAEQKDPKLRELVNYFEGPSALIFSRLNPFKLSRTLQMNKINAPAKPGMISPRDIVIPAGETDFSPGPIVGELQRAGIKARIQAGKVVVLEDAHIAKQGDVITKEVADVLAKLGIYPIELYLKLRAAYDSGTIFPGDVLAIDETQVMNQIRDAFINAVNLSINVNYPTDITIGAILAKASAAAHNVALNACLPIAEILPILLTQANARMLSLATAILARDANALDERLKEMLAASGAEPKIEEKRKEESKEEKPKKEEITGLGAFFG